MREMIIAPTFRMTAFLFLYIRLFRQLGPFVVFPVELGFQRRFFLIELEQLLIIRTEFLTQRRKAFQLLLQRGDLALQPSELLIRRRRAFLRAGAPSGFLSFGGGVLPAAAFSARYCS